MLGGNLKSISMFGKFIVIDGIDGVGKATQTELLMTRLKKEKILAKKIDFPAYTRNFFGRFIGECLAGDHGDFVGLDPKIASTLYAADRFESKNKIEGWLAKGHTVIADRYVSSNQIHQGGKIRDRKAREEFLKWLDMMEYKVFKLPKPDEVIYLSLPMNLSLKLLSGRRKDMNRPYLKGRKKDIVEQSLSYLEESRRSALEIVRKNNSWREVVCNKGDVVLSREVIHELVWKQVQKVLK